MSTWNIALNIETRFNLFKIQSILAGHFITARCTTVQSAVLLSHVILSVRLSVFLSVTLVDHDHIGGKSWKLIA